MSAAEFDERREERKDELHHYKNYYCSGMLGPELLNKELLEQTEAGDVEKVRILLGKQVSEDLLPCGADVNTKNEYKRTPLFLATNQGDVEMVTLLLEKGADKDIKDMDGRIALDVAKKDGDTKLVALLRNHVGGRRKHSTRKHRGKKRKQTKRRKSVKKSTRKHKRVAKKHRGKKRKQTKRRR